MSLEDRLEGPRQTDEGAAQLFRYDEALTQHRTPEHPVREDIQVLSLDFNARTGSFVLGIETLPVRWT